MKTNQPTIERQGAEAGACGGLPVRGQIAPVKKAGERRLPGRGRSKALKSLDPEKRIQGNPSFFLC